MTPKRYLKARLLPSPLHANNVEMALVLLDHGASFLNDLLEAPRYPLAAAAGACSVDTVSMLVDRGARVNVSSETETPLGAAIASKNEPVVRFLLDRGARISSSHIEEAVKGFARLPLLQLLINKSPPSWLLNVSILDLAAYHGNITVVQFMVNRGAEVELLTSWHVRLGSIELVKLLLDAGADPMPDHATLTYGTEDLHCIPLP